MKRARAMTFLLPLLLAFAVQPQERVRPPAVADAWYPGDARELGAYLDRLLDAAGQEAEPVGGRVRALIVPHAGYMYSGAAAAQGYRLLRGADYDRVLVLGPAHRGWFHGLSIADVDAYETPLGRIPLDTEAVISLRQSKLVRADPSAHVREHSIEIQLPWLQRVLQPGWRLLPVLVGDLGEGDYAAAADLLRPLVDGRTLVVVSSDFTHYGSRFGYLPFPQDADVAGRIEALDRGALKPILDRDPGGLLEYQKRTGITVCGYRPIALLLHLLPAGVQGHLVTYATSGQLTGSYDHSVSYLTILFRDAPATTSAAGGDATLSDRDMRWLHSLASTAVEAAAKSRDPAPRARLHRLLEQVPAAASAPSGAFVTLKRHGRLRGCMGYIPPSKPLFQAVAENGVNAALRDRRFAPLREEELEGLEVEVSVLTPPTVIDSFEKFRVGEEGIILEKAGRSAVFLPEVATEQGWDREQTLNHLARKAGLAEDAWREGARFLTFHSHQLSGPFAPVAVEPATVAADQGEPGTGR